MSIPFQRDETITRTDPGSRVRGEWVNGATSTLTIKATVLPEKNAEIIAQLGGTNLNGVITIRTETALRTADEITGAIGDKLTFEGRVYEVQTIDRYRDVIPHYKAWATLTDDKENS